MGQHRCVLAEASPSQSHASALTFERHEWNTRVRRQTLKTSSKPATLRFGKKLLHIRSSNHNNAKKKNNIYIYHTKPSEMSWREQAGVGESLKSFQAQDGSILNEWWEDKGTVPLTPGLEMLQLTISWCQWAGQLKQPPLIHLFAALRDAAGLYTHTLSILRYSS